MSAPIRFLSKIADLPTEQWARIELQRSIRDRTSFDLTTPASSKRISFPYPYVTPYEQFLCRDEGQDEETLKHLFAEHAARQMQNTTAEELLEKIVLGKPINVTSKTVTGWGMGKCYVTTLLYSANGDLYVSNSHAGTHADQPPHWEHRLAENLQDPIDHPQATFDWRQYNGEVHMLDLAERIRKKGSKITRSMLEEAASDQEIDLQTTQRLIVRTYHDIPSGWDANFPYLEIETGNFLGRLPKLLLFATDAPSVDNSNAGPIFQCAHGGLWDGRVAILEGIDSGKLPYEIKSGILRTDLCAIPGVVDSKRARVIFYKKN